MKLRSIYKSIIIPAAISSALLIGAPNLHAKQSLDSQETHILEFDYKKGEINKYDVDIAINLILKGYLKGHATTNSNYTIEGEVTEEDEGDAELEARITKMDMKAKQEFIGIKNSIELNWDVKDKNIFVKKLLDETVFNYSINKTGEIYQDFEKIIDFFPDEAVKIGDTWNSEGVITTKIPLMDEQISTGHEGKIKLKLAGKTKYKGINALLIDFSGESEIEDIDGEGRLKGQLIYDPIAKKILQLDINLDTNITSYIEEDKKLEIGIDIKSSIKRQ